MPEIHFSKWGGIPPLHAPHRGDLYILGGILLESVTTGLTMSYSYLRLICSFNLMSLSPVLVVISGMHWWLSFVLSPCSLSLSCLLCSISFHLIPQGLKQKNICMHEKLSRKKLYYLGISLNIVLFLPQIHSLLSLSSSPLVVI